MLLNWDSFTQALGKMETESSVVSLLSQIAEVPVVTNSPDQDSDPLGKTTFYKFDRSGVEIGWREKKLHHIHFFVQAEDEYECYAGPITYDFNFDSIESTVVAALGLPFSSGGGKNMPLLGYMHKWLKYENELYSIRFEFSKDGSLRKVSLISPSFVQGV